MINLYKYCTAADLKFRYDMGMLLLTDKEVIDMLFEMIDEETRLENESLIELQDEVNHLEEENTTLEKDIRSLELECVNYNIEIQRLKGELDDLQDAINKRDANGSY
jgi:predicted  nucleic acid-binding Zn-ribbon protein